MKYIVHNRVKYYSQATRGELLINGERFCYTLEDTCRPIGIKVTGETAIPENNNTGYKVGIRYSNKFKRDVLILYTENDEVTLNYGGISFGYIYAHGGNKHQDTEGCVLVGKNVDKNTIYNTAEKELFEIVKSWLDTGEVVRWVIQNFKQAE